MNSNVRLTLIFTVGYYMSAGIWGFVVLGPYLYSISGGSNSWVGYAEGVQGIAQAVAALPSGYFSDKYPRQNTLRVASAFGVLATVLTLVVLYLSEAKTQICLVLGLWGLYKGTWNPPLQSLYADSVPTGSRSKFFTWMYAAIILGSASGPLTAVILFSFLGNNWDLEKLRIAFAVGIVIGIPSVIVLLGFKDTLGDAQLHGIQSAETEYVPIGEPKASKWIPAIAAVSDCIAGLASGMTIKFFPLFFENESNLHPITVNIIYTITPLGIVLFSLIAQKISTVFGRIQVVILFRVVGISLLVIMGSMKSSWTLPHVIIPIYIARTMFMNCTSALSKSVLMDFVSKSNRGKWNSFESITSFGWSGSAVIGGILTDKYGYGVTFFATAGMQALSVLVYTALLPLVPSQEHITVQNPVTVRLLEHYESEQLP